MNAEELRNFVGNEGLEWHWHGNMEQVYLFLRPYSLREFSKLVGVDSFIDGGLSCSMCPDGDICIGVFDLCLDHGIDPKEVFNRLSWDSDEKF